MTEEDRRRWNDRYRETAGEVDRAVVPEVPTYFADHRHRFPASGRALDVACGIGSGSLWLAERGLDVEGVDGSTVAISSATAAADQLGLTDRCRFAVIDLDDGLPPTPPLDVIMCHRYRNPALYRSMLDRLAVGGLLAIAVLSEVGSAPGRFRAEPGELRAAFGDSLDVLVDSEGAGGAVLIGVKRMTDVDPEDQTSSRNRTES